MSLYQLARLALCCRMDLGGSVEVFVLPDSKIALLSRSCLIRLCRVDFRVLRSPERRVFAQSVQPGRSVRAGNVESFLSGQRLTSIAKSFSNRSLILGDWTLRIDRFRSEELVFPN